jgi:hypothetical protein
LDLRLLKGFFLHRETSLQHWLRIELSSVPMSV